MPKKYDFALYSKIYRDKKKDKVKFDFNKAWNFLMDSDKVFVCSDHDVQTEVNKAIRKSIDY